MKFLPVFVFGLLMVSSCKEEPLPQKCFEVTATAYNSLPYQTRPGSPGNITAWGDTLHDSIPSIAISRDLLDSGLFHKATVFIKGYEKPFVVNDKMHRRFKKRIDLHMGKDVRKARKFGRQKLTICYLDTVPVVTEMVP